MKLAAVQPPQLRTLEEGERTATWLELFYDLVFVASVAALGVRLAHDASWEGWTSYAAYFALVWWLWASHTFYADRYDTDDLVYRLLAGVQMVAIAFIAASLSADHGSTVVFAGAYAAARLILLVMYARVYRHVEESRELVKGYLIGFGTAAVVWVIAIFVPDPARFWLWGLALAIDLATPFLMRRAQAAVPLDVSHLPERFGLFTILVLGESIVAVTVALGHVEWQWATSITGGFGIVVATAIWWIHFDNVDGFVVRRRGRKTDWRPTVWIYSHLPLAVGIAMVGVGIEYAIVAADHHHEYHSPDRWVLLGGAAIAFSAMAAIQSASVREATDQVRRRLLINRLGAVPVVLMIGVLGTTGPVMTMLLLGGVCLAQVAADMLAASVAVDDPPSAGVDAIEEEGTSGALPLDVDDATVGDDESL